MLGFSMVMLVDGRVSRSDEVRISANPSRSKATLYISSPKTGSGYLDVPFEIRINA